MERKPKFNRNGKQNLWNNLGFVVFNEIPRINNQNCNCYVLKNVPLID